MSTIPERLADVVPWCKSRLTAWAADPAAIGLDGATVASLEAQTEEALAARRAYMRLRDAADAALQHSNNLTGTLRDNASVAVGRVRAHAAAQASPSDVLAKALLPGRRDASPMPAPGTPFRFEFRLLDDGSIEATFKCDNRADRGRRLRGVVYEVRRRDGDDGGFEHVCTALERRFRDGTIPPGTPMVTYQVTALTSTRRGTPARKTVHFGSGCVSAGEAGARAA
ncbi:MAG: hypothetical protein NCW75_00135 [Phycisphaera sp.]|nr:MAG: hypothetical protein NCW75_00135 [Phycisphaera sp.]